jgi:tetratricopeptide (TPR) repeat protein
MPASQDLDSLAPLPSNYEYSSLVLSNRGFLYFANDRTNEALRCFTELLGNEPISPSLINNVALCHLFSGNVGQAANFLESYIVSHPEVGGANGQLLFNLCSMFDLTDSSMQKKRALLRVIIPGCGDDFDPATVTM